MNGFEKALFKKRLNRFTIQGILDGQKILAYLPNPGRLWELLIPDRIVFLKKSNKTIPYTAWAVIRNQNIICLHTHYTNFVAETLLNEGLILKDYRILSKEKVIKNHRIDFLLLKDGKDIPLEVKSCTLYSDWIAMFPDAITIRGKKHIELLSESNGELLFIVHSPDVKFFLPDFHTDPLFSKTLYENRFKLKINAIAIKWDDSLNFQYVKTLDIPWHIYESEAKDKGSYLIVGLLLEDQKISIKNLKERLFQKGFYIYVSSEKNSLTKRLNQYRRMKEPVQPIDYLISYLTDLKIIPIQSSESLECLIANDLLNITECFINDFGSFYCDCKSHLYFLKNNPFENEQFINIILKYRINRLSKFL